MYENKDRKRNEWKLSSLLTLFNNNIEVEK